MLDTLEAPVGEFVGRRCYVPSAREIGTATAQSPEAVIVELASRQGLEVQSGDVVWFPDLGQYVRVAHTGGGIAEGWLAGVVSTAGVPDSGLAQAVKIHLVDESGNVATHVVEVHTMSAAETSLCPSRSVAEMVDVLYEALSAAEARHAGWKVNMAAAACELADEQSLCSEFDDFMEEWELPSRRADYRVEVKLRGTVVLTVGDARSEEDAEGFVDVERVADYLRDTGFEDLEIDVSGSDRVT